MRMLQGVLRKYRSRYSGPERRKAARKTAISTAWVLSPGSELPAVAVVWDLSTRGARVTVADCEAVPTRFWLLFSRHERPGIPCRIAWRSGQQIGAEFLTPIEPAALDTLLRQTGAEAPGQKENPAEAGLRPTGHSKQRKD